MVFEYLEMIESFVQSLAVYGYAGIFAMSFLGSATVILPVPYFIVIFGLASVLDPIILTIVSGVGSALGEFVAFFLGRYGSHALIKKHGKWFNLAERWFKKNGFLTLVFLAAAPGVADFGGILAGALEYNKWKFLLANVIGKLVKFGVIVYAGYYSIPALVGWLGIV
jgi:membrane protein DedA with SNARE-associated domain